MSFGYSVGDFVAAADFVRKAVGLLDGFGSSSEPSLNELRIGIRELQPRVEILCQRWIQSSTRIPSSTTLTAIKQLTDKLEELIKLLQRSEKRPATRRAHTELQQTEKMQSNLRETQDLIDVIESYIRLEEAANIKPALE